MAYYVPRITAWVLQSLIQKQPTKEFCQKQPTKNWKIQMERQKSSLWKKNHFAPPQKWSYLSRHSMIFKGDGKFQDIFVFISQIHIIKVFNQVIWKYDMLYVVNIYVHCFLYNHFRKQRICPTAMIFSIQPTCHHCFTPQADLRIEMHSYRHFNGHVTLISKIVDVNTPQDQHGT